MKKDGGVKVLVPSDQLAANQFFDSVAEYGIFAVRSGELENWLSALAIPGKKTEWTVAMLSRLGSDPADPAYVHPSSGDVWDFLRNVIAWIRDPNRKGAS